MKLTKIHASVYVMPSTAAYCGLWINEFLALTALQFSVYIRLHVTISTKYRSTELQLHLANR